MSRLIVNYQNKVLKLLSGKASDFYLAGGTALSLYYFHHRESMDLDFFTHDFSRKRISEITEIISSGLKKDTELAAEQLKQGEKARLQIFLIPLQKNVSLKIDFIEDFVKLIKPLKVINGINVLSLEDIYMRKIFAITGGLEGRQEAKDFFDLYCLSNIFMGLNKFCAKYCNRTMRESIIRWFHTYKRMDMKIGLLELKLNKDIDYAVIERHFKRAINKMLEKEVEEI